MSHLERVEAQLAFNEERALYSQMSLSLYEEAIPNFDKAPKAAPNDAIAYSLRQCFECMDKGLYNDFGGRILISRCVYGFPRRTWASGSGWATR